MPPYHLVALLAALPRAICSPPPDNTTPRAWSKDVNLPETALANPVPPLDKPDVTTNVRHHLPLHRRGSKVSRPSRLEEEADRADAADERIRAQQAARDAELDALTLERPFTVHLLIRRTQYPQAYILFKQDKVREVQFETYSKIDNDVETNPWEEDSEHPSRAYMSKVQVNVRLGAELEWKGGFLDSSKNNWESKEVGLVDAKHFKVAMSRVTEGWLAVRKSIPKPVDEECLWFAKFALKLLASLELLKREDVKTAYEETLASSRLNHVSITPPPKLDCQRWDILSSEEEEAELDDWPRWLRVVRGAR